MKNFLISTLLIIPFLSNTLILVDDMVINPSFNNTIVLPPPDQVESLSAHKLKEEINYEGVSIDGVLFVKTMNRDFNIQESYLFSHNTENYLVVLHGDLIHIETTNLYPFNLDWTRPLEATRLEFEEFNFADYASKKGIMRWSGGE